MSVTLMTTIRRYLAAAALLLLGLADGAPCLAQTAAMRPEQFLAGNWNWLGRQAQPPCPVTAAGSPGTFAISLTSCASDSTKGVGVFQITTSASVTGQIIAWPTDGSDVPGVYFEVDIVHGQASDGVQFVGVGWNNTTAPVVCATSSSTGCISTGTGTDVLMCSTAKKFCNVVGTSVGIPSIAWVQGKVGTFTAGAISNPSATFNTAAGTGHAVVCFLQFFDPTASVSSASDGTNSYTLIDTFTNSGGSRKGATIYNLNVSGTPSTVTATVSPAATNTQLICDEFSKPGGGIVFDGHATQNQPAPAQTTDILSSGTFATTGSPTMIWGANMNNGAIYLDQIGTGFTLNQQDAAGSTWGLMTERKLVSSGSNAATFTPGGATASLNFNTSAIGMK